MFDCSWNLACFNFLYDNSKSIPSPKPKDLTEMFEIAHNLARYFEYVRIDLYNPNDKIYVGELTFTHSGGSDKVIPNIWDKHLGDLWQS